jgi:hypothetical protein
MILLFLDHLHPQRGVGLLDHHLLALYRLCRVVLSAAIFGQRLSCSARVNDFRLDVLGQRLARHLRESFYFENLKLFVARTFGILNRFW